MPIIETLFLVSLIEPPSRAWEEWTKVILSIAIPLLIVSGGLFYVAWRAFRSGKEVWTTLAVEFLRTPEFKAAVNDARKQAEWDFTEKVRTMIADHNGDNNSHYVWRHGDYTAAIHAIQQRLFELEKGK